MTTVDGAEFFAGERLKWRENVFQKHVLSEAADQGWGLRYHVYFSDRSERGFPDLVLVRERVVFVELKAMPGRTTPMQVAWGEGLAAAGAEYHLWRPCCYNSGEIQAVLQR